MPLNSIIIMLHEKINLIEHDNILRKLFSLQWTEFSEPRVAPMCELLMYASNSTYDAILLFLANFIIPEQWEKRIEFQRNSSDASHDCNRTIVLIILCNKNKLAVRRVCMYRIGYCFNICEQLVFNYFNKCDVEHTARLLIVFPTEIDYDLKTGSDECKYTP